MYINVLEKADLGQIIFVRFYMEFIFEGDEYYRLTAYIPPMAVIEKQLYDINTVGWRDALCTLINKVVKTTEEKEEDFLKIIFEDGDELIITLKEKDTNYRGYEAAQLSYGEELCIWHSS